MDSTHVPYRRQIFVCTNDAKGEKASCGDHKGEDVFRQLREIAKNKKLHPEVRVAQARCLGQCQMGLNTFQPRIFPPLLKNIFSKPLHPFRIAQ